MKNAKLQYFLGEYIRCDGKRAFELVFDPADFASKPRVLRLKRLAEVALDGLNEKSLAKAKDQKILVRVKPKSRRVIITVGGRRYRRKIAKSEFGPATAEHTTQHIDNFYAPILENISSRNRLLPELIKQSKLTKSVKSLWHGLRWLVNGLTATPRFIIGTIFKLFRQNKQKINRAVKLVVLAASVTAYAFGLVPIPGILTALFIFVPLIATMVCLRRVLYINFNGRNACNSSCCLLGVT